MTAAIPGHGYRCSIVVKPACKCGWIGRARTSEEDARTDFEAHKALVRHKLGLRDLATPEARAARDRARHLKLVR
jgi:hypothetical protein